MLDQTSSASCCPILATTTPVGQSVVVGVSVTVTVGAGLGVSAARITGSTVPSMSDS